MPSKLAKPCHQKRFGLFVDPLSRTVVSDLLTDDHAPHSKFFVSSNPRERSHKLPDQESLGPWPISAFAHYSPRKLSTKIPHHYVACMAWSTVLLPQHSMPIYVVGAKISLDDVVYNSQVFSAVEIPFDKMWTQDNTSSCQTSPYHQLVCALRKFNVMTRQVTIAMCCIFFLQFLEFISEFKLKIASSDTINWSRKPGLCSTMFTN